MATIFDRSALIDAVSLLVFGLKGMGHREGYFPEIVLSFCLEMAYVLAYFAA